ncbi:MAG: hypothetical protein IPO83_09970 [Chitinophagaceae bacterium]|nr:hypothetical protein [Chitinophagaceae bacterium]
MAVLRGSRFLTNPFHSSSVGAIAVAASDPNIIYVGMGEAAIRNTAIMGDGIYKSIDAGKTWKHQLTFDASAIGQIIIHPKNPEVAYAAVMGKIYGANKERGVYRTKDGGKSWQQMLAKDDSTGAIDIDLIQPTKYYLCFTLAGTSHAVKLSSGGAGCGLYKTIDGGDTWKLISKNPGMPKGLIGKYAWLCRRVIRNVFMPWWKVNTAGYSEAIMVAQPGILLPRKMTSPKGRGISAKSSAIRKIKM